MAREASKAVLITGCSSGIGEATARRLVRHGFSVYASARRVESIEGLAQDGCELLQLDVTDEQSMRAAVARIEREHGAVGVLVNNAGYSQGGPIEQVPMDAVRRQFETNVFGAIALTQMVLPAMRAQRWGRVVNIGSMGGRMTLPGGGLYHATKYALEAISDALRFEVRGFGIDVTLIEPGLITTRFGEKAVAAVHDALSTGATAPDGRSGADASDAGATPSTVDDRSAGSGHHDDHNDPYATFNAKLAAATVEAYEGPLRHLGGGPEVVAKAIERAIARRHAPSRMLLTPSAHLMIAQRRLLPDRAWDALMRTQLPEPRA